MFNWIRNMVSKEKKRFQQEGFDLDLTYINDRIIAMGFPAQGLESIYRNNFTDVKAFLDQHHGSKYWVYNLCSERPYSKDNFDGRVECFPFEDHNPPLFDMIRRFCVHASDFLNSDPDNIIVVHCKAGKGRTGVMICALMLHVHTYETAQECLEFYGKQRTHDTKGVTIPSQRRYVNYYGIYISQKCDVNLEFQPTPCQVRKVTVTGIPAKKFKGIMKIQILSLADVSLFETDDQSLISKNNNNRSVTFNLENRMPMYAGDFRLGFYSGAKMFCYVWVNSEFLLPAEEIQKIDVDKIAKKKKVGDEFKIMIYSQKE